MGIKAQWYLASGSDLVDPAPSSAQLGAGNNNTHFPHGKNTVDTVQVDNREGAGLTDDETLYAEQRQPGNENQ